MRAIVATAAIASLFALSATALAQNAAKQNAAKPSPAPAIVEQPAAAGTVSPSGNPEWDVYVNGQYVGSDPDPRVRWSIRKEAVGSHW